MTFKKIVINNFKAIGSCELELDKQGFVAIRGRNNSDPNTANCGTGKSSISDALSYALCGETVKGGTDVKNQYTDGDCTVSVEFERSGKDYVITRSKGKSLQLIEDGIDISGKGIRDTQNLIEQMFPEFTPEFIGATLIFGQKMPNAFTVHTGSKRKEILEKLTKSDFQIEEIKERLSAKKSDVAAELRKAEDDNLKNETTAKILHSRIANNTNELSGTVIPDYAEVEELKNKTQALAQKITTSTEEENTIQQALDLLQIEGIKISDQLREEERKYADAKAQAIQKIIADTEKQKQNIIVGSQSKVSVEKDRLESLKKEQNDINIQKANIKGELNLKLNQLANLEKELAIAKEELVKIEKSTVCPTCGKAWGDDEHKVDLEPYKAKIKELQKQLESSVGEKEAMLNKVKEIEDAIQQHEGVLKKQASKVNQEEDAIAEDIMLVEQEGKKELEQIECMFQPSDLLLNLNEELAKSRQKYVETRQEQQKAIQDKTIATDNLARVEKEIQAKMSAIEISKKQRENLAKQIADDEKELKVLNKKNVEILKKIDKAKTRQEQVNKLYNFATKRFRTILLEDTIELFEAKAQEIAQKYFGVDITFKQDGANIDITYQGKQFENLSGGEECTAVIVIQTALRELLFDLMGEECNLLFIDECTDGADMVMSEKIMTLVGEYNTDSVFIISHHDELNLPTDRTLIVEKNNNIAEVSWG